MASLCVHGSMRAISSAMLFSYLFTDKCACRCLSVMHTCRKRQAPGTDFSIETAAKSLYIIHHIQLATITLPGQQIGCWLLDKFG
jgi:hypothetical protein